MASASSQIRSTKTYLWYLNDVLGTGATSTVYRGRHKKTGELVAAKAFNSLSFMRPQSVQQREFDVLLKLNHRNIVRLYDIEQDQISKNPVIIMELCSGGSLYNLLEDPKNSYGIEEEEFKRVLGDVCAGMKHLRDLDIVHRDIKPGNIMIVTADDGSSVYKLADFGAARELQDDENFVSLYGTEEYLHPDLYERAVLRQTTGKTFSARIDLWSIGITFYHVLTGVLPFRPYGGRKNRETMFQITTKKASGVISGVQRDHMNGPIDWSSELPETCRLSDGLKTLLTKILRGLLECNPEKMLTFNRFFDEVQVLLAMKVLDVFHVSKSECLKVYVDPGGTLAEFQEGVAEQTGVPASTQCLIWERDCFYPDVSLKCAAYPETTPRNPIILLEKGQNDFPQVPMPSQPKLPKMTSTYDLDKDAAMAKNCVAVLYFILAWLQTISTMQELMTTVSKAIISVLNVEIKQLDYHCVKLKADIVEVDMRLLCIEQSLPSPGVLAAMLSKIPPYSLLYPRLQSMLEVVTATRQKAARMTDVYHSAEKRLMNLAKCIIDEDQLTKKWTTFQEDLKPCYTCLKRFECFTEEARKIHIQFKKDKQKKQLSYNDEQIHKMDKEKLNMKSTQAVSMCQSHCEVRWKTIHAKLGEWYTIAYQLQSQIRMLDKTLSQIVQGYQTLLQDVHMLDQDARPLVAEFEETLQDCLMSTSPATKTHRKTVDVTTNTDSLNLINGLIAEKPKSYEPEISPDEIKSISEQLAHLPMDSNGCVLVPKDVKVMFEAYERDLDAVNAQMSLGKQRMEAMQEMSLSMAQESLCPFCSQTPLASGYQGTRLSPEGAVQFDNQTPLVGGYYNMPVRTGDRFSHEGAYQLSDRAAAAAMLHYMPDARQRLSHEGGVPFGDQAPVASGYQYMPDASERMLDEGSRPLSPRGPPIVNKQQYTLTKH